jgi:hypothetical protein
VRINGGGREGEGSSRDFFWKKIMIFVFRRNLFVALPLPASPYDGGGE